MNELQQLLAMLDRAGIGHGRRIDYNPSGETVQIEAGEVYGKGFQITEFSFDSEGKLKTVDCYPGEIG